MKRDALVAVVVALLAVVALGVAAATLDSAVDTGSGGFGGGAADAPSSGDTESSPQVIASPGGGGPVATTGACLAFLRAPPALAVFAAGLLLVAAVTYRDTGSTFASGVVAGVIGAPVATLLWVLSSCQRAASDSAASVGVGDNGTRLLPEAAVGGGGIGGGEGAASAPQLLFALVVVAAVVASVGALLLAGGDDEGAGGADGDADEEADEPPSLDAIGRAAGEAADRIESSDADNEVYRAWRDMTDVLDVERPASSTPAEFAAAAIDAGVDEGPVTTLTEVFERVRYGGEDATDDRERRAVAALRRIEERHGGDS